MPNIDESDKNLEKSSERSSLEQKLIKLKESLSKAMNNSGIGGAGSVISGALLPNLNKPKNVNNNSLASKIKIPGLESGSKKNPMKQIQQIKNKDIKDMKMREAQSALKTPMLKVENNGQRSLNEISKSESKPNFEGDYHGQSHEVTTERGHHTVRYPKKKPDGTIEYGQRKIPTKVKITHVWDHDKKEWSHKDTKSTNRNEGQASEIKTPMDAAREKMNAAPKSESKVKTIRRKLQKFNEDYIGNKKD
jgi:hypothetical protein